MSITIIASALTWLTDLADLQGIKQANSSVAEQLAK